MPITPLHFGVIAPATHLMRGRISPVSFVLANLCLDYESIWNWWRGVPLPAHGPLTHSAAGAAAFAAVIALGHLRSKAWVWGAFTGTFTHIALDSLVHPEMHPLWPMQGNPFYMGWMAPLSVALVPFTVWFIAQFVQRCLSELHRIRGRQD